MLRYYSYYSIGGYKDLYLGSSEDSYEATWYFPLLPIMEEEAKGDPIKESKVVELKNLPSIHQLSSGNYYSLPKSTRVMFSHAGYKILFRELEEGGCALAIRDVVTTHKDEIGRSTPFLMVVTGETLEDKRILSCLVAYIASHIKQAEAFLSCTMVLDVSRNGYKFRLKDFNDWILDIVRNYPETSIYTSKGIISTDSHHTFAVLPQGVSREIFRKEQSIEDNTFVTIDIDSIGTNVESKQSQNNMSIIISEDEKPKYSTGNLSNIFKTIVGFILYWIGKGLKELGIWLIKLSVRVCRNN